MMELTTRRQVQQLFADLRKNEGMIAKAGFMCCGGCAGAAIDTPENRGKPAVYFHKQEWRAFNRDRTALVSPLHLIYGVVGQDSDVLTEAVGRTIAKSADRLGIPYEWNGDPTLCFKILPHFA